MSVRVRFPFRVLERLAARRKTDLQPFLFPERLPHPNTRGNSNEFRPKTFSNHRPTLSDRTHTTRLNLYFTDHVTDTFG